MNVLMNKNKSKILLRIINRKGEKNEGNEEDRSRGANGVNAKWGAKKAWRKKIRQALYIYLKV